MKVGDPVVKYYGPLANCPNYKPYWGKGIYFIKAMDKNTVQLAQEEWPMSHFGYADIAEIKPAQFSAKAHKEMWTYRDRAIIRAAAETNKEAK